MKIEKNIFYFGLIAFISIIALSVALISQHYFGAEPCAWCIAQRIIIILIAFVSIVGIFVKNKFNIFMNIVLSFIGLIVALYQTYIVSSQGDCSVSLAEKIVTYLKLNTLLPSIFESYALCTDSIATFLSVSFVTWGMLFFIFTITISIYYLKSSSKSLSYFFKKSEVKGVSE